MKLFREVVRRLIEKINLLERTVVSQSKRLSHLEAEEGPSLHAMEVAQQRRIENEEQRRNALSDSDLRLDLEKQYGRTKWANKLIDEMLTTRIEKREIKDIAKR